jgi:hypothetical protein
MPTQIDVHATVPPTGNGLSIIGADGLLVDLEILNEPSPSLWCSLEPEKRLFRLETALRLLVFAGRSNLPEKLPIL